MTTDRWEQINRLYYAVLEIEEKERPSFLQEACKEDAELRSEVQSLLAMHEQADDFLRKPAVEEVARNLKHEPPSLLGRQLGPYQVLEVIGAGGMGEVYKAQDTRLNRSVAVKVLPSDRMSDPEPKRRFIQEARAASALNHPNIITIHDIGSESGIDFIVMEHVSGQTLDQRIPRKGMRLNEALKIAMQMADALAKAHSAGIVHRDLKPGNVMVTDEVLVKVLDFGLAKLTEVGGGTGETLTRESVTEEGMIVGTVSYMSPEQAEGKKVDARSDIFSFGAVLYEMVSGQKAFQGDTKMSTLAAIVKQEPKAISQLVSDVPPELEKIINRCLRKDPARRFQTMADLKVFLEELKHESDSGKLTGTTASVRPARRIWLWVGGAIVVATMAVAVWHFRGTPSKPQAALEVVPLTSYPGYEAQPSFSPDGNQVAFSWDGDKRDNYDIYVKDIASGAQLRLTTRPEEDISPSWSPDGHFIAFFRGGEFGRKASVYLVSPFGPPERKVAEISETWGTIAWTPNGKGLIVSDRNSENEPRGLFFLSVETGERRRLTFGLEKKVGDLYPALSPDGRTLAFIRGQNHSPHEIYLLALSEDFQPVGEPKQLTFENRHALDPVWTPDGREIIFSSGPFWNPTLLRIPVSGSSTPQRLAGVGEGGWVPAVSRQGQRLAYARRYADANIWRVEVPGVNENASPEVQLTSSTLLDVDAGFSPDGNRIAFVSTRTGSWEIWTCKGDGSDARQLTSLGAYECRTPRWSPDGEQIAFESDHNRRMEIYIISANGGKPKRFTNSSGNNRIPSWSRDGKWIYFASERSGEPQVWKAPVGGGEAVQVTRRGGSEALESPDGLWLYYTKNYGDSGLWKIPPTGGEETQVLESVDAQAFAIAEEGIYFIPKPDSSGIPHIKFFNFKTKQTRTIKEIGKGVGLYLSVSPDGRSILHCQWDQEGSDLMLVENFQ